ncbi:MAG: carboxypeptidase-like regulatory domain-containing protein [Bacteroidota bacterium]
MKYLSILMILLSSVYFSTLPNDHRKLCGTILDATSGQPVYLANVSILGTALGVVSDQQGRFELKVPKHLQEDSLSISYLSYDSHRVKVSDIQADSCLEVRLNRSAYLLSEVRVQASRGAEPDRLQRIIQRIGSNHYKGRFLLEGFYREIIRDREVPVLFAEAACQIYDNGYNKPIDRNKHYIKAIRKTKDFRGLDSAAVKIESRINVNGLYTLLYDDFIRNHLIDRCSGSSPYLNANFPQHFYYRFDSSLVHEGEKVSHISFYSGEANGEFIEENYLRVRDSDAAIIEMQIGKKINVLFFKNFVPDYFKYYVLDDNFFAKRVNIKYQEYKGWWFLKYLSVEESFGSEFSIDQDKMFFRFKEFLVTDVALNKHSKSGRKKYSPLDISRNMHEQDVTYKAKLWENYNRVSNPTLEKIYDQLSKK